MRTAPSMVVLGALCIAALGVATNVATSVLPDAWRPYLWIAWPALAVLAILFVIIEVRRAREDAAEVPVTSKRSRTVLLERVHRYWIQGVLERSFYHQARIELGLESTVDAVHPWDIVATAPDRESRLLPPGTAMQSVFRDLDQTMLVLGAPGSGKTTMLLDLLNDLLAAAVNTDEPIPVMLNLTSWTQRRETLTEWIVREVSEQYHISTRHVRGWLAADGLLPLLDGLDEVDATHREGCVAAINDFRRAHPTVPIAVSCRGSQYEELHARLRMYGTLRIQPLTPEQVRGFLDRLGSNAASARAALARQPELFEVMSSPLMLSMLVLAIEADVSVDFNDADHDTTTLFRTFVVTVLRRRPSPVHPPSQILASLAFLAYNLQLRKMTLFTIDLIDHLWLPFDDDSRLIRRANMVSAAIGFLVMASTGFALYDLRGALIGGAIGVAFGLPSSRRQLAWDASLSRGGDTSRSDWKEWLGGSLEAVFAPLNDRRTAGVAAAIGVASGIALGWSAGWLPAIGYIAAAVVSVLLAARLSFPCAFYIYEISRVPRRRYSAELPSPKVRWGLLISVPASIVIGLITSSVAWLILTVLTDVEGRFVLLVGVGATAYALTYIGLYFAIEQAMTRLVLGKAGWFPLPARPLLDHATRCLLLHAVGDSYMFSHQKLLDFFESLHDPETPISRPIEELVGP